MSTKKKPTGFPPKPKLEQRPPLEGEQAIELESIFKTLANATRLRILHALVRAGELCVGDIAKALDMKAQAVSNQLQRLSDRGIVAARRDGLQIHYRIVDPCVISLLDKGWCLTEDARLRAIEAAQARGAAS